MPEKNDFADSFDWNSFYEELREESPRGAVIIAASVLDAWLRELLSRSIVADPREAKRLLGSDERPDGLLTTFNARAMTAYCLGLLSPNEYHDLRCIGTIRNKFAHKMHGFSFDDPVIVSGCESLRLPKAVQDVSTHMPKDHGTTFVLAVVLLGSQLSLRCLQAKRAPIRPEAEIIYNSFIAPISA